MKYVIDDYNFARLWYFFDTSSGLKFDFLEYYSTIGHNFTIIRMLQLSSIYFIRLYCALSTWNTPGGAAPWTPGIHRKITITNKLVNFEVPLQIKPVSMCKYCKNRKIRQCFLKSLSI